LPGEGFLVFRSQTGTSRATRFNIYRYYVVIMWAG